MNIEEYRQNWHKLLKTSKTCQHEQLAHNAAATFIEQVFSQDQDHDMRFIDLLCEMTAASDGIYEKGVTLTKKAMDQLEKLLDRIPGIEKWAVDIPCYID